MGISNALRTTAVAAGSIFVGTGSAGAQNEAVVELPAKEFICKPIGPENRLEPPPPLAFPEGESAEESRALRTYAENAKLSRGYCSRGAIAVPNSTIKSAPKMHPPRTGLPEAGPKRAPMSSTASHTTDRYELETEKYRWVSKGFWNHSEGASVEMNVADPEVEEKGLSHSIAQITMTGLDLSGDTVELGWRVTRWQPEPRLFTYVNKDDYTSHGERGGDCFNCHFTPVVGADYLPGQALPISPPPDNDVTLLLALRQVGGNWWVWVGDQWIGYLDGDFWSGEFTSSPYHSFYGEVFDDGTGKTDMGNGNFGSTIDGSLMRNPTYSFFKDGQWHDRKEPFAGGQGSPVWSSHPSLYDGYGDDPNGYGRTWKFGGPGSG